MQDSIVIENLTRKFPGFVLDNVSFTVPRGSIMGFVGENGARYILKVISTTSAPISTGIRA